MYHLPLLPGYGPHSNIRSSVPTASSSGEGDVSHHFSEAEEIGYQGTYFTSSSTPDAGLDGYISNPDISDHTPLISALDVPASATARDLTPTPRRIRRRRKSAMPESPVDYSAVGEVVFFSYGVAVFFGLEKDQEHLILDDISNAGVMKRKMIQDRWEIEECHYVHDPSITYPRIYNDFFS
jgi:uncharacterized Rmd1/YagE family protein